ncbi:agmatine deiminase family protein [Gammaproteobacteria bacterium AB-CW1]|uniref:Agmatine deiminase family protein n=1 Tax=Natronospira elongata TaxID=3110268 RepID=A0AAP6JH65_9GAMM|nr:agmatine deiminase family protein [Gammaproteobacteria bacterium AB-CW1]
MENRVRLPAEWAAQSAVQLTWPHDQGDWEDNLQPARACFTRIATALSRRQTVLIVARDLEERQAISSKLAEAGGVLDRCRFAIAPTDDSWARDHSPLCVTGPEGPRLIKFEFNGWGGRYRAELDNALPLHLADQGIFGDTPLVETGIVLEGGAVECDGEGRFLLRRSCIVDDKRNPGMDTRAMSRALAEWLGADTIHWLDHGDLSGDDTDGHIDTLARFAPDGRVLYQGCQDTDDEHHPLLTAMAEELAAAFGRERLIELPLPEAIRDSTGRRMPAGYANFLVANEQVLVPTYQDPSDALALERIGEAYPGREVVGIDCRALVRQGGSLHCVTMQYPAGVVPPEAGLPAVTD